ncbi:hypothetical protein SEA_FIRECASTLE_54 [Microbacterium phage FireCastle]
MATAEAGRATIDGWLARIENAIGPLDGGSRFAVSEVLQGAFQHGVNYNAWEPVEDQEVQGTRDGVRGTALYRWWMETAHNEIAPMVDKITEYGGSNRATDLTELGRVMVESGVKHPPILAGPEQDAFYQELGCFFYLQGKFGRWVAAIKEGRPVSDDTLHDIGIYVRMVQRIRAAGGWPV